MKKSSTDWFMCSKFQCRPVIYLSISPCGYRSFIFFIDRSIWASHLFFIHLTKSNVIVRLEVGQQRKNICPCFPNSNTINNFIPNLRQSRIALFLVELQHLGNFQFNSPFHSIQSACLLPFDICTEFYLSLFCTNKQE